MAELPGNIHEKIGDLRVERGLTKKQVSKDLGIPASQLTRIENQDIKSIGHELIIKFADYFGVSTDYLLGRTSVRTQKNIDLDQLGLSHKALVRLLSGKINMQLLSRMIEHKYFLSLMDYAEAYFESAHDDGFLTRNDIINMAVTDISEYVKEHPAVKDEALAASKQGNLDTHRMADITSKMLQPLGLGEEQMQAFKDLMVDILHEESENNNNSEVKID